MAETVSEEALSGSGETARVGALAAIARGWFVFPIRIGHNPEVCAHGTDPEANCKTVQPLVSHWREASTDDPLEVDGWDWSRINAYGIDCGKSGLVVADEDPAATWPFNGTMVLATGRGKHHVYADSIGLPIRNGAKVGQYGVDIRADGGMIIGPGSWHPHGEYRILIDCEPAEISAQRLEVREALLRAAPTRIERPVEIPLKPLDPLDAIARLESAYATVAKAPDGSRNDTLNTMAFTAGGIWARVDPEMQVGLLSEEEIKTRLFEAIPDDGNPVKSLGTIDRGWDAGLEAPVHDDESTPAAPPGLFEATPILRHIYEVAQAAGRSPRALLLFVLARVALEIPVNVVLPGGRDGVVGSRAPLNLGFAFTGISGAGKSDAVRISAEILGLDQEGLMETPSSGEGLLQAFLVWDSTTKTNILKPDPRVLFNLNEIATLGGVGARTGSTVTARIRTILMGEHDGTANSETTRRRNLPDGSYRAVLTAGVQPETSWILLDEAGTGLPQRLCWVWLDGTDVLDWRERPPYPEPLDWSAEREALADISRRFIFDEKRVIEYPQWLIEEVRQADYERHLGGSHNETAHLNLTRLKLAVYFAALHGELDITARWWRLAGILCEESLRAQEKCRAVLAKKKQEGRNMQALSDAKAVEFVADDRLQRCVKQMYLKVVGAEGAWVSKREIRPSAYLRDHVEDAVEVLEGMADVEVQAYTTSNGREAVRLRWTGGEA